MTAYYPGSSITDSVMQDVVEHYLTELDATRFGQGWQLAELNRLSFSHTYNGVTAALWLRGDGSYAVYRLVGGVWTPPPGETTRLLDSTTVGAQRFSVSQPVVRVGPVSLGVVARFEADNTRVVPTSVGVAVGVRIPTIRNVSPPNTSWTSREHGCVGTLFR